MNKRLDNLRQLMSKNDIDVYYFNTTDYHMSEYVAEYFKTIKYFSGFTGSLATLLVDKDNAYIFVDGRYHIQADKQVIPNDVTVIKLGTEGALSPEEFIYQNYNDKILGLDGRRTSIGFVEKLLKKNIKIKSLDIYSEIIEERSPLSKSPLWDLKIEYTGKSRSQKLQEMKYILSGRSHVINNLESIAYLLNLRGDDVVYTPVFMSYLLFHNDFVYLFIDKERLSPSQIEELYEDEVAIKDYDDYYNFLKGIKDSTIILDEEKVNFETLNCLSGNKIVNTKSPVDLLKSIKNEVEIKNNKLAHEYDGVCMVRFIKWLKEIDKTAISEKDAADYLDNLRKSYKAFDLSFNSIVAHNENAAQMHYSPSHENPVMLHNSGILLVDSGGQYKQGTTDITRTISLGENSSELKKHFTIVLKSMFNLSSAVFMKGSTGRSIDILARQYIWAEGIDYRCGTGHGVGQVLSVHEMPPNIRYMKTISGSEEEPLRIGNIVSDEPGIYLEDKYGIRSENMLLVVQDKKNEWGDFYKFETLTLCPFDLDLIDVNYLDERTIKILNEYHKRVYETLSPYLNQEEKEFLRKETRPL